MSEQMLEVGQKIAICFRPGGANAYIRIIGEVIRITKVRVWVQSKGVIYKVIYTTIENVKILQKLYRLPSQAKVLVCYQKVQSGRYVIATLEVLSIEEDRILVFDDGKIVTIMRRNILRPTYLRLSSLPT